MFKIVISIVRETCAKMVISVIKNCICNRVVFIGHSYC